MLKKPEYLDKDFRSYVLMALTEQKITHQDMAKMLGLSPQTFRNHLLTSGFTFLEMVKLFQILGTDEEQILRLVKM
jgi:hypothetical protein